MDITISDDMLKKTTKCKKDFACLSSEKRDICKAVPSIIKDVVYIDCLEETSCPYRLTFGTSGYACECPVRVELCKKHGI